MPYFQISESAVRSVFGIKPHPAESFGVSAQLQVPDGHSMITTIHDRESSVSGLRRRHLSRGLREVHLVMSRLAAGMPLKKRGDHTVIMSCLDDVPSELWSRGDDIIGRRIRCNLSCQAESLDYL